MKVYGTLTLSVENEQELKNETALKKLIEALSNPNLDPDQINLFIKDDDGKLHKLKVNDADIDWEDIA